MLAPRQIISFLLKRYFKYAACILSGIVFLPGRMDAQLYDDYFFVKESNPWFTARNAAGLVHIDTARISTAAVSAEYIGGKFKDFNEAEKSLSLGAGAESFYQLGRSLVFFGSVRYRNTAFRNIAGSAFVDTYHLPFDLIEYEAHPGRAQQNSYHLSGALAGRLSNAVSLGARMDYKAADFAKYKDLRHRNSLMDLALSAGVRIEAGRKFEAGLDLIYRRSTESVNFGIYGTEDKTYWTLISYADFMGRAEAFGEFGYTEKSRNMPLFNEYKGLGVQLAWHPSDKLTAFISASYLKRDGYYGKKSTYTVSFNEHKSTITEAYGRLDYSDGDILQRLEGRFSQEDLSDYSNSFKELEKENSARYYEYYTPVKRSDKIWTDFSASYMLQTGLRKTPSGHLPQWTASIGYKFGQSRESGFEYPFYRRQKLQTNLFSAEIRRNFIRKASVWGVRGGLSYSKGSGEPFKDGVYVQPSQGQAAPASMDTYLYEHYEFVTAGKFAVCAAVRYTFPAKELGLCPYIDFEYRLLHSPSPEYLGSSSRHCMQLTIGASF